MCVLGIDDEPQAHAVAVLASCAPCERYEPPGNKNGGAALLRKETNQNADEGSLWPSGRRPIKWFLKSVRYICASRLVLILILVDKDLVHSNLNMAKGQLEPMG